MYEKSCLFPYVVVLLSLLDYCYDMRFTQLAALYIQK